MRTIRLDLQYEGTAYVGWQRQARGTSIQEVLEKALSKVASEKITLHGASRTDAGVHALHQVASFSLAKSDRRVEAFRDGTNSLLPPDIRVLRAEEVDPHFLARRNAKEKTYRYYFQVGREVSLFLRNYAWHIRGPLEMKEMKKAARSFVGEHDFSAFRGSGSDIKSSVRTVRSIKIGKELSDLYYVEITANGFLKHMVRAIVGTLMEVGWKKRNPREIREILQSKMRVRAGRTAPPHGLFLWRIRF